MRKHLCAARREACWNQQNGVRNEWAEGGEKVCDFCFFKCRLCGHAVVKLWKTELTGFCEKKDNKESSTGHVCCCQIFKAGVNSSRCPNKLREHPETQNFYFYFLKSEYVSCQNLSPPLTLRKKRRHKFLDLTWQWPLFLLIVIFLSRGGNAGFSFLVVMKTVFPLSLLSVHQKHTHARKLEKCQRLRPEEHVLPK